MLLEKLFENLALSVDPFATCAVAGGWRLQLPRRDWVVFHFILKGEGTLRLGGGEVHALRPNLLAVMPPGIQHSIECGPSVLHEALAEGQAGGEPICALVAGPPDEVELTVACGRVQVIYAGGLGLFDLLREALILDFSDSPQMRTAFEGLVQEYGKNDPGSVAMVKSLMNQCLVLVFRRLSQRPDCTLPWLSALDDPNLAPVLDRVLEHPEHPHSLESLAGTAHMSRSVFARRFHECFGRTPMDYVREARLRTGAKLLHHNDLSVGQIASRVGFASRSHFSRAFADHFGCSPKQFREAPPSS